MGTIPASEERRRHARIPVAWPAHCVLGSSTLVGEVCDWSLGGLFFRPEDAYVDGAFVHGEEIITHLEEKDQVEIIVALGDGEPVLRIFGTVRWRGASGHGPGFGVMSVQGPVA